MKPFLEGLAVSTLSLLLPAAALAQAGRYAEPGAPGVQAEQAPAPPRSSWDWEEQYPADPDDGVPVAEEEPPASVPPGAQAPEPSVQPPPPAQAGTPSGQWVYTQQYGWVWMPYADSYTVVPSDGYGEPYMYLYCPAWGWGWLVAPWVWGVGPWPFFGDFGPVHFGWYGHGWWRTPERWHWSRAPDRGGFWHGGRYDSRSTARGAPFHGTAPGSGRGGGFWRGGGRAAPPAGGGSGFRSGGSHGGWTQGSGGSSGWGRGSGGSSGAWPRGSGGRSGGGGWPHGSGGGSGGGWPHGSGGGSGGWLHGSGSGSGGSGGGWLHGLGGKGGGGGGRGGGALRGFHWH